MNSQKLIMPHQPTSDLPLTPPQTLATLRASLLETFLTSFRTAAAANDTNNIGRFFKLFPMIGEEDTGLEAYADWVSGIVRAKTAALPSKSTSTLFPLCFPLPGSSNLSC